MTLITQLSSHNSYGGESSSETKVTSGVPQGSVLGPILFLVMIDSIADCGIEAWIRIFTDDMTIGYKISSIEEATNLQDDLESIYNWQEFSNMTFNADKFEVLQLGFDESLKNSYTNLTPDQEGYIVRKEHVKDLGVLISESGDLKAHIAQVIKKVRQLMGWIKRCFINRNPDFMKFIRLID